MILQDKVYIKLTNRNRTHYKLLGYNTDDSFIYIKIYDLTSGSNIKIDISCDICNKRLSVTHYNYQKRLTNGIIYTCKKCSITHKTKITNIERYGVDHPLKSKEILEKLKNTNIERYGESCSLLSKEVKDKTKKTSLERYGVDIPCTSLESKENRKITNLSKYGKENVFQTDEFKKKMTDLRIESGVLISQDMLDIWRIYKNEVRKVTRIFLKELYDNWGGYDFYDGEYIKDNLNLHHNHRLYPTIDHKMSIFYGFKNKIPADKIGNISNLVITKRSINSRKNLNSV